MHRRLHCIYLLLESNFNVCNNFYATAEAKMSLQYILQTEQNLFAVCVTSTQSISCTHSAKHDCVRICVATSLHSISFDAYFFLLFLIWLLLLLLPLSIFFHCVATVLRFLRRSSSLTFRNGMRLQPFRLAVALSRERASEQQQKKGMGKIYLPK